MDCRDKIRSNLSTFLNVVLKMDELYASSIHDGWGDEGISHQHDVDSRLSATAASRPPRPPVLGPIFGLVQATSNGNPNNTCLSTHSFRPGVIPSYNFNLASAPSKSTSSGASRDPAPKGASSSPGKMVSHMLMSIYRIQTQQSYKSKYRRIRLFTLSIPR